MSVPTSGRWSIRLSFSSMKRAVLPDTSTSPPPPGAVRARIDRTASWMRSSSAGPAGVKFANAASGDTRTNGVPPSMPSVAAISRCSSASWAGPAPPATVTVIANETPRE